MKTTNTFSQLALIGSTASGKTSLSIKLAHKMNAYILSLDSLAIYKEINIVSAKPTLQERTEIRHFGINYKYPNETFDVNTFISLYKEVYRHCQDDNKNLIIVGGTSFYLKILIEGISTLPKISNHTYMRSQSYLKSLEDTYDMLYALDTLYMSNIASKDRYRIEKALHIYLETNLTPSTYFTQNPPLSTMTDPLLIYQIVHNKEKLRDRITLRTQSMLDNGLIDEICKLEKKYGRKPNAMKAIGIKETLAYLDGIYTKEALRNQIITHTIHLAKRQTTFNNSQFKHVIKGSIAELEQRLLA